MFIVYLIRLYNFQNILFIFFLEQFVFFGLSFVTLLKCIVLQNVSDILLS